MKKYKGKPFVVVIDRNSMERKYILKTIEKNGDFKEWCEALFMDEFEKKFGFSPEWPHENVK